MAYASVHLATLRYLLLFEAMLWSGRLSYGEIRDRQSGQNLVLTYATLLWELCAHTHLRGLGGSGSSPGPEGGPPSRQVAEAIDQCVEEFLKQAMQMKPDQVAAQLEAEQLDFL